MDLKLIPNTVGLQIYSSLRRLIQIFCHKCMCVFYKIITPHRGGQLLKGRVPTYLKERARVVLAKYCIFVKKIGKCCQFFNVRGKLLPSKNATSWFLWKRVPYINDVLYFQFFKDNINNSTAVCYSKK